jgi:hypothetical protein
MVVLAISKQEGEYFGSGGRRPIALPKPPRGGPVWSPKGHSAAKRYPTPGSVSK